MNKRHYEHTLPNIRGSLSNTYTRLPAGLHTAVFPANYSFAERKNLQGMHFKPPDQARQPTFAAGKPDGDGGEETGTGR